MISDHLADSQILTQDSAEILIHTFISSKYDYCNSLLYGIPKYLVCLLPLQSRIIFKLLLFSN